MICNCYRNSEVLSDLTGKGLDCVDIGSKCLNNYRIMLRSGTNLPVAILFEHYTDKWNTVGIVYPDYCPICGRELV